MFILRLDKQALLQDIISKGEKYSVHPVSLLFRIIEIELLNKIERKSR